MDTAYVVDTSVLVHDPRALNAFRKTTVAIPIVVVMELDDDASTGLVEATGVSVDRAGEFHEAFGDQSWRARGETGDPPGVIESAQLRGSRVQIEGRAASSKGGTPLDLSVDARCDLKD